MKEKKILNQNNIYFDIKQILCALLCNTSHDSAKKFMILEAITYVNWIYIKKFEINLRILHDCTFMSYFLFFYYIISLCMTRYKWQYGKQLF